MTLRVTFLGTSAAVPTTERNPSGLVLNREGDLLLFDVGEGSQRQMMRYGTGFGISDVFITHLHGDHILGLPGLLQTWDFTDREEPVVIHTPDGTGDRLRRFLFAAEDHPRYPVSIVEHSADDVIRMGDDYEIQTFATNHRTQSLGYALVEDDRKGRFDRARAEELGVPVGPAFSALHRGESVELDDGTIIDSAEVVGPPRPGRRVVYSGDTLPHPAVIEAATNADVLIHDATFTEERADRAKETAHSTAADAATTAAKASVNKLILTHISSRYAGDTSGHLTEAKGHFSGPIEVAHDGLEIDVPFAD